MILLQGRFILVVAAVSTAVFLLTGQSFGSQDGGSVAPSGDAESIVGAVCTSCHTLERVESELRSREDWASVVDGMIQAGARLEAAQISPVVDYLVRNFGSATPGEGERIVLTQCTLCHELDLVEHQQLSKEAWTYVIQTMVQNGAELSPRQRIIVVDYLAETYGQH